MIEPGRKLDIQVAEKIFKVKVIHYPPKMSRREMWDFEGNIPGYIHEEIPNFSTDINHAMLIVEHFKKQDLVVDMTFVDSKATCNFRKLEGDKVFSAVNCHSWQHAICIAGLNVVNSL